MKKISMLLLVVVMVFVVTGCTEEKIEEKVATCTSQQDTHFESVTINGENNKVTLYEVTYKYENSLLGVESMEDYTDEQKQAFVDNMYNNLGFEKGKKYDGFSIDIRVEDQVIVEFSGDVNNENARENFLKLGIDLSDANLGFEDAVHSYRLAGYTCK